VVKTAAQKLQRKSAAAALSGSKAEIPQAELRAAVSV
jgi:hypothetical protein